MRASEASAHPYGSIDDNQIYASSRRGLIRRSRMQLPPSLQQPTPVPPLQAERFKSILAKGFMGQYRKSTERLSAFGTEDDSNEGSSGLMSTEMSRDITDSGERNQIRDGVWKSERRQSDDQTMQPV